MHAEKSLAYHFVHSPQSARALVENYEEYPFTTIWKQTSKNKKTRSLKGKVHSVGRRMVLT
jgi:hypothetical protein